MKVDFGRMTDAQTKAIVVEGLGELNDDVAIDAIIEWVRNSTDPEQTADDVIVRVNGALADE